MAAERLAEVIESPTEVYADVVDLLVDGVAADQRQRLETIEKELEDVKKRLGRIWQIIETTDIEMADASERIREHRESKEMLEVAEEEARGLLAERRQFLDSADTIATTYFGSRSSAHGYPPERSVARCLSLIWLHHSRRRNTPPVVASPSWRGSFVRTWGRRPVLQGGREAHRNGWCGRAAQPRSSLLSHPNCSPILKPSIGTDTNRPRLCKDGSRNSR